MGRVTLNKKYKKYTGMLPPAGHRFYLTNRFGEEVISYMPEHRDPDSVTDLAVTEEFTKQMLFYQPIV